MSQDSKSEISSSELETPLEHAESIYQWVILRMKWSGDSSVSLELMDGVFEWVGSEIDEEIADEVSGIGDIVEEVVKMV